jgi:hypothetical protein
MIRSGFIDGVMYNDGMISLYKNPTYSDIDIIKSEMEGNSIRGIICDDGTVYAWNGAILHMSITYYFKNINIINKLKFSYEENHGWLFDASFIKDLKEYLNLIIKNKDKLLMFGNLNTEISIYNVIKDTGEKRKIDLIIENNDLNITTNNANYIVFDEGISGIEKLENFFNKK